MNLSWYASITNPILYYYCSIDSTFAFILWKYYWEVPANTFFLIWSMFIQCELM